ncbi:hypothetical protein [Streptomyces milbemycinicus]|uniref:hypothetical protein n=1 Tax=Streptomyces milbemycinicus TaxID=476552 RepID=UPI00340810B3
MGHSAPSAPHAHRGSPPRLAHRPRPAVLALIGCQIGAAALTATALAATSHVLAAVFTGGDSGIAADLRESLTSVVVLALAGSGRYLLDAGPRRRGPARAEGGP